jgi:photosystem II PsbX protein
MTSLFMTVTPSLNGFFIGLIAGAAVIGAAIGGLAVISQLDKVQRS